MEDDAQLFCASAGIELVANATLLKAKEQAMKELTKRLDVFFISFTSKFKFSKTLKLIIPSYTYKVNLCIFYYFLLK